jgi:hypothetical protein
VTIEVFSATHALRSRYGIAKGGSMHSAEVDKGMLGANAIGTPAVVVGQIDAVSVGYGPVIIPGQGQMSIATLVRS